MADAAHLRHEVENHPQWYHSIDLADGLVTDGWFDTRPLLERIPFPVDLTGMRCLDVATFDGFWAFEMERRGAAEVIAIDVLDPKGWDWPAASSSDARAEIGERKGAGEGFEIAKAALASSVERRDLNVYDLDPADIGSFDFIYVGSLLLHLRNPVAALQRIRRVCRGSALLVDAVNVPLTALSPRRSIASFDGIGRPWWFKPNRAALVRMARAAGFTLEGAPKVVFIPPGVGQPRPGSLGASARLARSAAGWQELLSSHVGDPHCAMLLRPDPSK